MPQIETPILLLGFNRPELTRRVLESVAAVQPRELFISLDGPRDTHPDDARRCRQVRQLVQQVDWPCTLRTRFSDQNLGCKRAIETGIGWFFDHVESGIVLEDDCLPKPPFFSYCDDLLDRYQQNDHVMCLSGNRFAPGSGVIAGCIARESDPTSYYFTKYMHCWGWATWRRAWRRYCPDLTLPGNQSDTDVIRGYPTSRPEVRYWRKRFDRVRRGRINTWDYGWQHAIWKHNGLIAAPAVNLVDNIGFGDDATHTAGGCSDLSPAADQWSIESHPDSVYQHVSIDRKEASAVYGFDDKNVWRAAGLEIRRAWKRYGPSRRAA